jgi:four helix bundle protein
MGAQHYKDLECWQLAHELKLEVFAFTGRMPAKADRDFCHDIRRSARSAPSNIAEGFGRPGCSHTCCEHQTGGVR